jgi:hypothetical protein
MNAEMLERARVRLVERERPGPGEPDLAAALDRARRGLEAVAEQAAELESALPGRLSTALHESMRTEVVPVARSLAEVRGLSGQTIRRLERLETVIEAERRARVDDLALLVDLVTSGWQAAERRLDRLERTLERLERELDRRAEPASVLRPA